MDVRKPTSAAELAELLRPHVADARVLAAIAAVPRECFVPVRYRNQAYDNGPLPIGGGQTISQPLVVARMCELLALEGEDSVLDVGTGSGYHAAVLSLLCAHVWSIERDAALADGARESLSAAGITNVTTVVGDGRLGMPEHAPYDAINVAAATPPIVVPALTEQLAVGGRLVLPLATSDQRLVLVRRGAERITHEVYEAVKFVPLV